MPGHFFLFVQGLDRIPFADKFPGLTVWSADTPPCLQGSQSYVSPHSQFSQHLAVVCGQRTHTVVLSLVIQAIKPQAKLLNQDPGRQPKRAKVALYLHCGSPNLGGLGVVYPSRRQGQYNLLGHNC